MQSGIFSVTDKVFVITGGSGLIGKSFVYAALSNGAKVANIDLNDQMDARTTDLQKQNYLFVKTDITNKSSVENACNEVVKRFGTIDVLVNNAAINDKFESPEAALDASRFENFSLDNWHLSISVNLTGTFLCSQVFGQVMAKKKSGSIINLASTYGLVGPDQSIYKDDAGNQTFYKTPSYPVTKGAIINFTRYLAAYWGNQGVRVNCLSPGGVENSQQDFFVRNYSNRTLLGRMASSDDYIGALLFLSSNASDYMTGANLVVDGGWTAI